MVEQGAHVFDGVILAIKRRIFRGVAIAMAAHIPRDETVLLLKRINLWPPHARGCCESMGQENRWSLAVVFVVESNGVSGHVGHCQLPE